jgi:hypothetical protein
MFPGPLSHKHQHKNPRRRGMASMAWPCRPHAGHAAPPPLSFIADPGHHVPALHLTLLDRLASAVVEEEHSTGQTSTRPWRPERRSRRAWARRGHTLDTRRATTSSTPWPRLQHVEHHRDTATLPDTPSTTTRHRRRRRREPWSAADATDTEAMRPI